MFEAVTAYDFAGPGLNLGGGDRPQQVKGIHVTADFFHVFRVNPTLGRTFTAEEDVPNGPKVCVLGDQLWRRRFGSDPQIVGKAIDLGGQPNTVVGVLPASFQSNPPADIYIPLGPDPNSTNQGHYLRVAGRLKPGVTVAAAQA